jgi:hypothetical protein
MALCATAILHWQIQYLDSGMPWTPDPAGRPFALRICSRGVAAPGPAPTSCLTVSGPAEGAAEDQENLRQRQRSRRHAKLITATQTPRSAVSSSCTSSRGSASLHATTTG